MSTGLDCYFEEKKPNEWYYFLERLGMSYLEDYDEDTYAYEETEYDCFGPFKTFTEARADLDANHANPGGWSVEPHPDSTDKSYEI